jgi:PQQ-like domain
MRDVVLDDRDGASGDRPSSTAPSADTDATGGEAPVARRTSSCRAPLRTATAVVALVAAAGLAQGVADAGPGAPLEGIPGALSPMDGPVRELWRTDAAHVEALADVGGLVVAVVHQRDGSAELVGRDPRTGVARWATPLVDGRSGRGGASCAIPAPDAAGVRVAVCVVVDQVGPVEDFSRFGVTEPTLARMVLIDPADGRSLRDEPVEPSTSVAASGADLLTSWVDADGHLRARRTDPWGERERWTFRSPDALPVSGYGRRAWVGTRHGLVLVGGDAGWVLRADGSPVHAWYPQPAGAGWVDVLGDGLLVQPSPDGSRAAEVVDLATARSFEVDGQPVRATLDDGSAPGLVVVHGRGDDVAGYAAPSGVRRWTATGAGTGAIGYAVVEGRVLRTGTDALVALDAVTGETVWSTPLTPAYGLPVVTDGHVVLCVSRDAARGLVLGAYDLDDGRLQWDVDVPDDLDELVVADGRLFGQTTGELIAFG